ncbi:unnamed protein product [Orchesella dallaii]|uniref:Uncharacterized protein n=1 Tax=Orchesella dallaii TaxID=48710 RepID=A0ABP1RF20_9HEXA
MATALLAVQNLLVLFILSSFQITETVSEEKSPSRPLPFHNLIPRFKMPRGNLLRYKIPQWEVLYFLKYGIVPFMFYDPNFNRTNFITQVHKFKMYFDDGRPNRTTQFLLKDDEAFREFLRKHGYPNYNQLPANALSRNNKLAEEINGLLRTASSGSSAERRSIFGQEDEEGKDSLLGVSANGKPNLSNLDELIEIMKQAPSQAVASVEKEETVTAVKKMNPAEKANNRRYFWNAFINRYPMLLHSKSLLGTDGFLVDHDPGWVPRTRSTLSTRTSGGSDLHRQPKSFRLELRNVNSEPDAANDDATRTGEIRKGGKNFQTQGW